MIKTLDIAWAAGFIDGEGWFVNQRKMPVIKVKQNSPELLYRLQSIFGGEVNPSYEIKSGKYKGKKFAQYYLGTERAAGAMMTLFPLMSIKRKEEIKKVLSIWKSQPLSSHQSIRLSGTCAKGHDWTEENIFTTTSKTGRTIKRCIICKRANSLNWYHNKNKDMV